MFNVLGGHFKYSTVSVVFPLASLLSSLYWPWDPLSSLESTPVSIYVLKQVDCNMCRFSKLLLFSFFFYKDGSDRLMKRATYSCCNFLCVELAAAYLKYRRCPLSCLPFIWHFFHCDTHTHTHTHTHTYTHTFTGGTEPVSLPQQLLTRSTFCLFNVFLSSSGLCPGRNTNCHELGECWSCGLSPG